MLLLFVVLEFLLGPRLSLLPRLSLPLPSPWVGLSVMVVGALLAARLLAGVSFVDLGFRSWSRWTLTEKLYFLQVLVLANVVFGLLYSGQLKGLLGRSDLWYSAVSILVLQALWGFYQELMYRGILQTELTRRWGGPLGVGLSVLVFTFGPLHLYHLAADRSTTATVLLFAGIFAVGLFFSLIFHRTRNLWIVGVFHGIGNAYINGAPEIASLMG